MSQKRTPVIAAPVIRKKGSGYKIENFQNSTAGIVTNFVLSVAAFGIWGYIIFLNYKRVGEWTSDVFWKGPFILFILSVCSALNGIKGLRKSRKNGQQKHTCQ